MVERRGKLFNSNTDIEHIFMHAGQSLRSYTHVTYKPSDASETEGIREISRCHMGNSRVKTETDFPKLKKASGSSAVSERGCVAGGWSECRNP
ncbi:hypothetical protein SK128_009909 [Halocaridina rubra]|uniref:Uncharacterized protein n=1 Tax=Halocaridina rubra TaxID=373956 RepID=A0AAN9A6Y0_HALRR